MKIYVLKTKRMFISVGNLSSELTAELEITDGVQTEKERGFCFQA